MVVVRSGRRRRRQGHLYERRGQRKGLGVDAGSSSFALAVGDRRIWVRDSFMLRDPNDKIGLLFGFRLLEIA